MDCAEPMSVRWRSLPFMCLVADSDIFSASSMVLPVPTTASVSRGSCYDVSILGIHIGEI